MINETTKMKRKSNEFTDAKNEKSVCLLVKKMGDGKEEQQYTMERYTFQESDHTEERNTLIERSSFG